MQENLCSESIQNCGDVYQCVLIKGHLGPCELCGIEDDFIDKIQERDEQISHLKKQIESLSRQDGESDNGSNLLS